jgi:ABC-2 type transport system ATP-binding protein
MTATTTVPAVQVHGLCHRYGERVALDRLDLHVAPGEVFGLVGPNGGGKTTAFRVLATLIPPQEGSVKLFGHDVALESERVRRDLGVVFQAASLDKKLTVGENLMHHGHLYGMRGADLRNRCTELLERLGLSDRRAELAEQLSGGLRRRVELAKALLHRPRLLLLDEATTGLDPSARRQIQQHLQSLRQDDGLTIVLTTHLLEEADRCDRIGILDQGRFVALGAPEDLKAEIGGEVITLRAEQPAELVAKVTAELGFAAELVDGVVRIETEDAAAAVGTLHERFAAQLRSMTLARPTLEDVFFRRTGHAFQREAPVVTKPKRGRRR